jgi:hypothetical protein
MIGYDRWQQVLAEFADGERWTNKFSGSEAEKQLLCHFVGQCCFGQPDRTAAQLAQHPLFENCSCSASRQALAAP